MNDPQFDDFLRKKLESRQHTYQPEYWKAAEALLDAQSPRRRRRRWWWVLLPLGLLLGLSAWYGWQVKADQERLSQAATLMAEAGLPVWQPPACPDAVSAAPSEVAEVTPQETVLTDKNLASSLRGSVNQRAPLAEGAQVPIRANTSPEPEQGEDRGQPSPSASTPEEGAERLDLGAVYALKDRWYRLDRQELRALAVETDGVGGLERRHSWQLELGLALAPGWRNTGLSAQPYSLTPSLGLGYTYALRPGLRLQVGLRYQGRSALGSDSTYLNRRFGFGLIDTLSTVAPQQLHSLALPLRVDLRVWQRHYLQLGVQPSWLLNVSGELIETASDGLAQREFNHESRWGYRQGFQPWDLALLMGYRYYLGQGLRLGLSAQYGLTDQTQAAFFGNERVNRHVEMRVMLEYSFH